MKIKYFILILISTLFYPFIGRAQDDVPKTSVAGGTGRMDNLMSGRPEVSNFHKVNFLPINLYTGKVNINIPLYEVKSGNISVPVSLTYDMSGIKIDQYASNVGQNWVLQAGGSVTRIKRDLEDVSISWVWLYKRNSWSDFVFDRRVALTKGALVQVSDYDDPKFLRAISDEKDYTDEDAALDLFIANGPLLQSSFNLKRLAKHKFLPVSNVLANIKFEEVEFKKKYLKQYDIYKNYGQFDLDKIYQYFSGFIKNPKWRDIMLRIANDTTYAKTIDDDEQLYKFWDYSNFKLTNDLGLKYNFDIPEYVESVAECTNSYHRYLGHEPSDLMNFYTNSHRIRNSAWHLSKIEDQLNGKSVDFEYESVLNPKIFTNRTRDSEEFLYFVDKNNVYPVIDQNLDYRPGNSYYQDIDPATDYLYTKNILSQRVKKIKWEEGVIEFEYLMQREDFENDQALSVVKVYNLKRELIKHYIFNYSYYRTKEGCNLPECKRLKLVSIQDASNNIKLYEFAYDESVALPKTKSFETDFLGFYNDSKAQLNNGGDIPIPRLYYSPKKNQLSILPIKLFTESYAFGDSDKSSNSKSLAGLLCEIKYATGGKTSFEYENHSTYLNTSNVLIGGARIKKQFLINAAGDTVTHSYQYADVSGKSTGYFNKFPKFADIVAVKKDNGTENVDLRFKVYNQEMDNVELTEGSFIGYSYVKETVSNGGVNEHYFSSPKDKPNVYGTISPTDIFGTIKKENSDFPSYNYSETDPFRGRLMQKNLLDDKKNLLKKTVYNYDFLSSYPKVISANKVLRSKGFDPDMFEVPVVYSFTLKDSTRLARLKSIEETTFGKSNSIITVANLTYNNYNLIKEQTFSDKDGRKKTVKIKYPVDFLKSGIASIYQDMFTRNLINLPIEQVEYNNDVPISGDVSEYQWKANFMLPYRLHKLFPSGGTFSESSIGNDGKMILDKQFLVEKEILNIDKFGNPIELSKRNAPKEVYIWGYNGQYPLGKIINATYNEVVTTLGGESAANSIFTKLNEVNVQSEFMANQFTKLRNNLTKSQVYNYDYKPLVGKVSITDIAGKTTFYEYDGMGRLILIKDFMGNVIQTFCYNYAGQYIDCMTAQPIYKNRSTSSYFRKNNCPSGMEGQSLQYSIPEGQFSSLFSQEDADRMALEELNKKGQQYANDNGSCSVAYSRVALYNNSSLTLGSGVTVVLWQGSTRVRTLTFPSSPGGSTSFNDIPPGTYRIDIYVSGINSNNASFRIPELDISKTGSASFDGVSLSSDSGITIIFEKIN